MDRALLAGCSGNGHWKCSWGPFENTNRVQVSWTEGCFKHVTWGTPFRGPKKLTESQIYIYIIDLIGHDFSIIFFWDPESSWLAGVIKSFSMWGIKNRTETHTHSPLFQIEPSRSWNTTWIVLCWQGAAAMGIGNAVEARLKPPTGSRLAELTVVWSTSWGTPFRGPKKLTESQIYIIDLIGNDFSIKSFLDPESSWLAGAIKYFSTWGIKNRTETHTAHCFK